MMEVMLEKKMTLSELAEPFHVYPQVLKNIRVTDKAAVRADEDIQKAVSEAGRSLGEEGRILVRESGTEPVIRVMAEAGDLELCHRYVDGIIGLVQEKGYAVL